MVKIDAVFFIYELNSFNVGRGNKAGKKTKTFVTNVEVTENLLRQSKVIDTINFCFTFV